MYLYTPPKKKVVVYMSEYLNEYGLFRFGLI